MVESDQREVERFYQTLSTLIRVHGAEHLGRQYVVVRLARMEVTGPLDYSDIQRILARVGPAQLVSGLARRGAGGRRRGATARRGQRPSPRATCSTGPRPVTTGAPYLAEFGSEQKAEGRAAPRSPLPQSRGLLDRPDRAVRVPFEGTVLPGTCTLARRGRAGAPCVIMVNGADSVKEEYHNWARQFVRRGLRVLTVDGPGQGEMLGRPPDAARGVGGAHGRGGRRAGGVGQVDADRIGIWGSSMGGFLALRAAAFEPRLRAAISLGRLLRLPRLPASGRSRPS